LGFRGTGVPCCQCLEPLELLHRHNNDDRPAALGDRHWFGPAKANHGPKPYLAPFTIVEDDLEGLLADPLDGLDCGNAGRREPIKTSWVGTPAASRHTF